jgi:hypothetical protein
MKEVAPECDMRGNPDHARVRKRGWHMERRSVREDCQEDIPEDL